MDNERLSPELTRLVSGLVMFLDEADAAIAREQTAQNAEKQESAQNTEGDT